MPGSPRALLLRSSSRRLRLASRSEAKSPQLLLVSSQSPTLGRGQNCSQEECAPPGGHQVEGRHRGLGPGHPHHQPQWTYPPSSSPEHPQHGARLAQGLTQHVDARVTQRIAAQLQLQETLVLGQH